MTSILFAKSHFSLGESLLSPEDVVNEAVKHGYGAACLADTMTISGMIEFTKACEKQDIKPIIGVRLRVVVDATERTKESNKEVWFPKLIIKTEKGFKQVLKLLSLANSEERYYYTSRLSISDIIDHCTSEHVYMTTGDVLSAIHFFSASESRSEWIDALKSLNCYVEAVPADTPYWDRLAHEAQKFAEENDLPSLVTHLCTYKKGEADTLVVLNAISSNNKITDPWHPHPFLKDHFSISVKELVGKAVAAQKRIDVRYGTRGTFWGNGIRSHGAIVEGVSYFWTKKDPCLPKMAKDEFAEVIAACKKGWVDRFSRKVFGHCPDKTELTGEYKDRLKYELGVLNKMGFCGYFLLVQDIVKWSKDNDITVGPGRGSVGGSLVAYLMGITEVDPIRFGLFFERFINPDRIDLPDADLDFMSSRRHEVVQYIEDKYGRDYVAGISNYSSLASASALRDAGRVHNVSMRDLSCTKLVPKPHGQPISLEDAANEVPEIQNFKEMNSEVWKHALILEGTMKGLGRHAAGIVVGGEPLVNSAVVEKRKGSPTINWNMDVCESQGLVKLDILGLSTLDTLRLATDMIFKNKGKKIDLTSLALDDEKVITAFSEGDTIGIFQFESGGMQRLLKDIGSFEKLTFLDIAAATALYRPGPMDSGLMDQYVAIKQGVGEVVYDHEFLKPALEETYGVIVYQEQVMQAARDLAGFTMTESDHLRKAMGKKLKDKMAEYRDKWVDGCKSHAGLDEDVSGPLYDKIEAFAGYGFNKSHSVEYSLISYMAMWLKVYYPAEFYASALTILVSSAAATRDSKSKAMIKDAEKKGIFISPPDINISTNQFEILTEMKLCMPFSAIKGLSDNTANAIVRAREDGPFKSVEDFEERVEKRKCNKGHREKLDTVGAYCRIREGDLPALHSDRLKSQLELLPGLMSGTVKAERDIGRSTTIRTKLLEIVREYQELGGTDLLPRPMLGKNPKFMVITDAPSFSEVTGNQITAGVTFAQVSEALHINGLDKQMGYFTTLSKEQKTDGKLENDVISLYAPFLAREIAILKPPVIIVLGSPVARHLVKELKGGIVENNASVIYDPELDSSIVISISPGMIFMDPSKQKLLNEAFAQVKEIIS